MSEIKRFISVKIVIIKTIIIVVFFFFTVINNAFSESVSFEGEITGGNKLIFNGIMMKPDGGGPFPAVVMLHGCDGLDSVHASNTYNTWASRLVSWGYVTLQVDSLGPRGETNICGKSMRVAPFERIFDAYAGKSYLANQSYVNKNRIAVMGWSHGGWTALYAVNKNTLKFIRAEPYRAAIAFYPWCGVSEIHLITPLLILIGEEDDWTPANRCKNLKLEPETTNEVNLKVYPKAHHGFDFEGVNIELEGHQLKYDPAATRDAIIQVKKFLAKHLR